MFSLIVQNYKFTMTLSLSSRVLKFVQNRKRTLYQSIIYVALNAESQQFNWINNFFFLIVFRKWCRN